MRISTACGILKQCVRSKQKAPGVETRKDDQGFFFETLQGKRLFNQQHHAIGRNSFFAPHWAKLFIGSRFNANLIGF